MVLCVLVLSILSPSYIVLISGVAVICGIPNFILISGVTYILIYGIPSSMNLIGGVAYSKFVASVSFVVLHTLLWHIQLYQPHWGFCIPISNIPRGVVAYLVVLPSYFILIVNLT